MASNLIKAVVILILFGFVEAEVGPETCGVDRAILAQWFKSHGSPSLVLEPRPELLKVLNIDPYANASNPPLMPSEVKGVCGIKWSNDNNVEDGKRRYHMQSFNSVDDALAANFSVTHSGHCGSCSSLQDLGVYLASNLTGPVRHCALLGLLSSSWERSCMRKLDFSSECASIWHYNIVNTRSRCFGKCIVSWIKNEPFNKQDGALNECLQCDEILSYPNFNFFAGRTRRNSGIRSAIKRWPGEIYDIQHCYFYGDLSNS